MLFKMTLHLLAKAQYGDRQPQAHVTCLARILRGSCVAAQPPAHGRVAQVAILNLVHDILHVVAKFSTSRGTSSTRVVTADWYCTVRGRSVHSRSTLVDLLRILVLNLVLEYH
jgi:hypothetical protein